MITIYTTADHPDRSVIEERLKELTLAYQIKTTTTAADSIRLEDGISTYVGVSAITDYLDNTEGELNTWYYGSCGT